jgi:hypothetical protein
MKKDVNAEVKKKRKGRKKGKKGIEKRTSVLK